MAVVFAIVASGLMMGTAVVAAASPPWWVTADGATAGALAGSIDGGAIGGIAGAYAGAALIDYLYNLGHTQSNQPSGSSAAMQKSYVNSVLNQSINQMLQLNSSLGTESNLLSTSFYYFAQSMETAVPYFLGNSSLNATYVGYDSGMYGAADNLSRSSIYPLNALFFNLYQWAASNSLGSGALTSANANPTLAGNPLKLGTYYFINPQTNFYIINNTTASFTNVATGNVYSMTMKVTYMNGNVWTGTTASGDIGVFHTEGLPVPQIESAQTLGIPTGVYELSSLSITPFATEQNGAAYGPPIQITLGATTDAISLSSNGQLTDTFGYYAYSSVNWFSLSTSGTQESTYGLMAFQTANEVNIWTWAPSVTGTGGNPIPFGTTTQYLGSVGGMESRLSNMMSSAYSSAQAYFSELKSLGYTNAKQVPASLLLTLPSFLIPAAMLNGTFNATELQALYVAYLLQLKSWLNETSEHTLAANMTVNNATFTNGFVQLYGNLTVISGASKTYYNNTYFLPLINLGTWDYRVHTWTNITNGTPDPNWLITS